MDQLLVLCPSRGRPEKAAEAHAAFGRMSSGRFSEMLFVVDLDDPAIEKYRESVPVFSASPSQRRGMTDPLNEAVALYWDQFEVIGFVGDDHRFKTPAWDQIFLQHLELVGGGLAYGNDLNRQDGDIPTQIFGSAKIWKALGWMALPAARHLYLDNAWKVIGESVERLYYFPQVVIEHVHPAFGKAEWDDQYRELNAPGLYSEDGAAFSQWLESGQAEQDIARVRAVL
jgi:hypothetical protein